MSTPLVFFVRTVEQPKPGDRAVHMRGYVVRATSASAAVGKVRKARGQSERVFKVDCEEDVRPVVSVALKPNEAGGMLEMAKAMDQLVR